MSIEDAGTPSSAFKGVLIGLVSSFGSIFLITLLVFIFWVSGCAGNGRILLDRLGRPGEFDDEQAFLREEAEALELMDDMARTEYLRAKGKSLFSQHAIAVALLPCWQSSSSVRLTVNPP